METASLCKCNNCESVLIDQNPQINAKNYELNGTEIEMQYFQGTIENQNEDLFWGCPICETESYLTDI